MAKSADILLKIAERLRPVYYGVVPDFAGAAGGSTTYSVVTYNRPEPQDFFKGGTIFLQDATPPEARAVTVYNYYAPGPDAGTFVFADRGAIYVGKYAAIDKKYTRQALLQALNMALSEIGPYTKLDTSLRTIQGAESYTLPTGVYNVVRVQIAADADGEEWEKPHRWWTERDGVLWFDDAYLPDTPGRVIRVYYETPHPYVAYDSDDITDAIHPEVIAILGAIHALRQRMVIAGSSDPEPATLLQMLQPQYAALRAANPIRRMIKDARYPVFVPSAPVGDPRPAASSGGTPGGGTGGGGDTTAPTVPANLTASGVTPTQITVSWTDSTDAVGVTGYKVFRDGTQITTVSVASYTDTGLTASTTYSYEVSAYDAAGNESAHSAALTQTTAADPGDITPPTTPASLHTTSVTSSAVALAWTASTDAVGVVYYDVYRDGIIIANPTGTSYTDNLVVPGTIYEYTVDAVDAAGNHSQLSNAITPTTSAPSADVWYVSTTGSSSNPGTIDEPWTLDHALNGAAGGSIGQDDTVYLRGGTYTLNATQIVTGLNGASGHRITVAAYPGERVTIRNVYLAPGFNSLSIRTNDYVDFVGLEFTSLGYGRGTASPTAVDLSHVFEDAAYTIDHIRWINCKFHDSPGRAMFLCVNSTYTEVEGCIFYYNGSGTLDYTMQIHGATGSNKCIRKNVFIHNASDDVRVFSTTAGSQALENIDVDDNIFLSTGSLFADPGVSILLGGETDVAKNITVDNNVVYNRLPADGNSRAYQLGNVGVVSTTTVNYQIAASTDDGGYAADGTFKTNGTEQVGVSGGPLARGAFYRFINVAVPQGAHITAATLTVNVNNTSPTAVINTKIRADKSSVNPTAPADYATITGRTKTTQQGCWYFGPGWTTGDITSPDFSNVIQEITDQGSWASGNALILYWDDDGSTDDVWCTDRSTNTALAARISITYQTTGSDGGANTVSGSGNLFIGQPVDLSAANSTFTAVTFSSNTVIYPGSHVGSTEATYTSNTWTHSYPTSQSVVCKVLDTNSKVANLVVFNWANASSVTVLAADLTGLSLNNGDSYILANLENYYTDRITGIYNGSSIIIPMTGRTQAATYGDIGNPASLFPTVGAFQIIAGTGPGGGNVPPSVPTGLVGTAGASSIQLTWNASSGPTLAGYTVYRDGAVVTTTTSPNFTDTGLAPGSSYTYQVDAFDSLGNHSDRSASVTVAVAASGKFVSVTGSNTNPGTISNPWNLLYAFAGAGGAITPGTVVWVRGGTYSITGTINIGLQGTASAPIQFRAYPGERVTVRMNFTNATQIYFNGASYVQLYDFEFTGVGYTRTTEQAQGTYEHAIGGWTSGGVGVKLYGCHIKNAATHGWRAFEQNGGFEFNGCIVEFNGSNNQYDHGIYIRGNRNTLPQTFKNCIVAHNASHGLHGWGSSNHDESKLEYIGNLIFQNGSLYNAPTRQALIGNTALSVDNNNVSDNIIYTNLGVDGNADAFRLGYGGGHTNNRVEGNYFVGSPVYIDGTGTGDVFLNNTLYYGGSQRGSTTSVMTGNGNTIAAIPSSGTVYHIRTYTWDSRRANIGILNFASLTSVVITNADLVSAGLTIHTGETYELHNAENYYGDVITGTYNGTSIVVPMTGRTVETPYGLPKPPSAFPKFGAFVIRTRAGA